jgi:hypothetical protein
MIISYCFSRIPEEDIKQKEQPGSCSFAFVYDEVLISLGFNLSSYTVLKNPFQQVQVRILSQSRHT